MNAHAISGETFWQGSRYRLYRLGDAGKPECFAEADTAEAVGVALVTVAEDNRLAGLPAEMVGVLDAHSRRWVSSLWESVKGSPFHH